MAGPRKCKDKYRQDHVSVEIRDGDYDSRDGTVEIEVPDEAIVDSIKAKLGKAFSSQHGGIRCSIFRVHKKFLKINGHAYSPEVILIGPLHRGKPKFQAMEHTKLLYMHALLYRMAEEKSKEQHSSEVISDSELSNINECARSRREILEEEEEEKALKWEHEPKIEGWSSILKKCVAYIKGIEEEARYCYSERIPLKSHEFVQIMLIDGLFIIEFLLKLVVFGRTDRYDPVLSKIGDLVSIMRDLLLLENQIPMLVLTGLFEIVASREIQVKFPLNRLMLYAFNAIMPREKEILKKHIECRGNHILDFIAKTFHPSPRNEQVVIHAKSMNDYFKVIPNATEMKQSGIQFKKGSAMSSFLDIKFNIKKGELEIPPIIIARNAEVLLKNIIAYEQCLDGEVTYMSCYAFFMDSLIDSAEDVRILSSKDIIKNYLGSDEDVANLFNKLPFGAYADYSYYIRLYDELNTYCSKERNIWRATLKRDYFNGPWAYMSFFAALLLLLLTLTSTIFAIIPVVN